MQPILSVVIVNWNAKERLRESLSAIFNQEVGFAFEVLVVDNASSDGSDEMARSEFPVVRRLENSRNLGFAAANNLAIKEAKGELILLLNPDAVVKEGCLQKLVAFLKENKKAGAVGPKIINADGSLQLSCHFGPSLFWAIFFWLFPELLIERLRIFLNPAKALPAGYVSGACLLLRRKALEDVGLLDEDFFLYAEEADWCLRARRKGWQIYFLSDAEALHYGKESTRKYGLTEISRIRINSNYRLIKKHFGVFKAGIFGFILSLSIRVRMGFALLKPNPVREEKLKIYQAILEEIRNARRG
ncbi:MAG: glycosyltransferase family 2 protein [Candidatus Omnitrophota bacterium]